MYISEQYDEMKSIVEAVFARMPGSVCKRDALLKWCGEKLANYVSFNCLRNILIRLKYSIREFLLLIFQTHGPMELHFVRYYIVIYLIKSI